MYMVYTSRFDKRLRAIPNEVWLKIARIDELKGRFLATGTLSPQFLGRLKRSVLVTSTGASTRIEGAKLSDEAVERLMRGISIEKFADRDQQEVRGYFELLQNIFDSWQSLQFNESSIKHFHKELLKYSQKDVFHRGNYKRRENKVRMVDEAGRPIGILFDTTPAYLTAKEMSELVDWTKKALQENRYHSLLIIGNFLVEFLKIHPFEDGNGRLSRILANLLFLKEGYLYVSYVSHEKLIEDNKTDYYLALRNSQNTFKKKEDIGAWLDFFLKILLRQSQMAIELLTREHIESVLSPKQLILWQYLQEAGIASPGEIARKAHLARPTVNQILNKLLKLNKIERIGEGSAIRYRLIQPPR